VFLFSLGCGSNASVYAFYFLALVVLVSGIEAVLGFFDVEVS
jgi:hypothetical protein